MNLNHKNIFWALASGVLLTIFVPLMFPSLRLLFFVPFLIILFYQKSLPYCLWAAFFCGLFIDLLSNQSPFGFYAFIYTLTAALIYRQKRNFFSDHLSTLPLMTFLFSFTATALGLFFLYIFGSSIHIGIQWIFTDLVFMPLFDGLYAFVWFILLPMALQKKPKRRSI